MKPAIAITVGDYNGIGPEVVLKSIRHPAVRRICTPVLVGPTLVFEYYARKLRLPFTPQRIEPGSIEHTGTSSRRIPILESSVVECDAIVPGDMSAESGKASRSAIEQAVRLALEGHVHAIVTAPVSKQALHRGGASYPGQTEMLQTLTSSRQVAMMLVSKTMRVGLVTIHIPVAEVAAAITPEILGQRIHTIYDALRRDWRIRRPRIAVLGLNPHAGEGGDIGSEEASIITPTLQNLRDGGMRIEGPFPADGFFGRYKTGMYDAIVAMYHDQGLIPLKMSSFGAGVNVTAGLPIVRTSPDHGTAFEIAGKGIANPGSMIEAVKLAVMIAANRIKAHGRKRT